MSRKARILSKTGYYHIILRGVNRQNIFFDNADREKMLSCLATYCAETKVRLAAYCLMSNHIHLLVHSPNNLDTLIRKISSSYVYYFNHKYGRIGHLFQERFKSEPVETRNYLLTVFRYILQNPLKAGICSVDTYRWSSFRETFEGEGICQISDIIAESKDLNELRSFVLLANEDTCMDVDEKFPLDEENALRIATQIAGMNPLYLSSLAVQYRNCLILQMLHAGLSRSQVARFTGLSLNILSKTVQKAKRNPQIFSIAKNNSCGSSSSSSECTKIG